MGDKIMGILGTTDVQAIIALLVVGALVLSIFLGVHDEANEVLGTLAAAIVGFYYGAKNTLNRNNGNGKDEAPK